MEPVNVRPFLALGTLPVEAPAAIGTEHTSPGLIGSGKWQTRTVMKILESEVYTGDLVQGKTKILSGSLR